MRSLNGCDLSKTIKDWEVIIIYLSELVGAVRGISDREVLCTNLFSPGELALVGIVVYISRGG